MRRRSLASMLVVAALSASSCTSHLGRTIPGCDPTEISTAVIIAAQSVPGTAFTPCVNDLKPGWEYEHLEVRSGQTRFWLSSDRVGSRFLEVRLEAACEIGSAVEAVSDEDPIPLFLDEMVADYHVTVTVISEGADADNRIYAKVVAGDLRAMPVSGRAIRASVDETDGATSERIDRALDRGRPVLVVGSREYEEGTVELHLRSGSGADAADEVTPGLALAEALAMITDRLDDPSYEATWYYPFENGCVTYLFDAHGPGVESVVLDVQMALGLMDMGPLRAFGEEMGYVVP